MNLIFGLSAFVMAGITIWQNRHYLRAIKMPWGNEVYQPSPSTSTDIKLTGDRTSRIEVKAAKLERRTSAGMELGGSAPDPPRAANRTLSLRVPISVHCHHLACSPSLIPRPSFTHTHTHTHTHTLSLSLSLSRAREDTSLKSPQLPSCTFQPFPKPAHYHHITPHTPSSLALPSIIPTINPHNPLQ
jgi:hypothetical protein